MCLNFDLNSINSTTYMEDIGSAGNFCASKKKSIKKQKDIRKMNSIFILETTYQRKSLKDSQFSWLTVSEVSAYHLLSCCFLTCVGVKHQGEDDTVEQMHGKSLSSKACLKEPTVVNEVLTSILHHFPIVHEIRNRSSGLICSWGWSLANTALFKSPSLKIASLRTKPSLYEFLWPFNGKKKQKSMQLTVS